MFAVLVITLRSALVDSVSLAFDSAVDELSSPRWSRIVRARNPAYQVDAKGVTLESGKASAPGPR